MAKPATNPKVVSISADAKSPRSTGSGSNSVNAETLKKFYRDMLVIRRFEERAGQLYGMGLIGGFCHLYIGQEAVVVGMQSTIVEKDAIIAAIPVAERKPGAETDLRADNTMAAEEVPLLAEHVHRAALALGIAAGTAGQFGHHALRIHAAGQHMAVVAIGGDDSVALFGRRLHADHHGLLADVKVAEAADQAHAVELARLLLEAADQQHVAQRLELALLAEFGDR